jgi:peptide deformylase
MTLEINPIFLFEKCEDVTDYEGVSTLIKDMFAFAQANNGVGLAANQVGYNKRIIIVNTRGFKAAMINPVITKGFGSVKSPEGCLSFPKGIVRVERAKQITVEWRDDHGEMQKQKFRGLEAMIIQHETDHLNGITIFPKEHALRTGEIRR